MGLNILWSLLIFISINTKAQFTSSNLPIILVDTDQGVEITKERITASMRIVNNPDQRNSINGPYNEYDGRIAIKGRGSSSWGVFAKKGYTLETQLPTGENNNVPLLGMPEENDWVLHGPYADKTLMKNAFVYTLGSEIGRYTPRHHFCELLLNGEYRGVYLLVERIKRDKNRVDIATLNPDENIGDDLTGGYIMRIDRDEGDGFSWEASFGYGLSYFNYYYPESISMSQTQRNYIRNYIGDFEYALLALSFADTQRGYRAYADVGSFIDYFIISELTKNIDAYRLSTYFSKDKDSKGGKLNMGPIWDFNLSCGGINIGFGDWGAQAENWVSDELPGGVPFWWNVLLDDTYYNSCLQERWTNLRNSILNESHFNEIIDGYATLLDEAKERNFEIYPLADPVWGNNHAGFTYEQEVDTLKGFMRARLAWMDAAIEALPGGQVCEECFTDCPPFVPPILSVSPRDEQILSVYPNPATTTLVLHLPRRIVTGLLIIQIHDLSGRVVLREERPRSLGQTDWSIDISNISQEGLFLYEVRSGNGLIGTGSFVKQ